MLSVAVPGRTEVEPTTQPATIVNSYNGGYKDDFPQELVRVQSYVLPVQSDIATLYGLQYGQGFLHPVTIRFTDGAPAASENPFYYVQTKGSGDTFSQDLVVNVEAFAKRRAEPPLKLSEDDMRNGFRYALTKIMLNDLSDGDPDNVWPLWVQEGLAVYASGDGDSLVKAVAEKTVKSRAADLVEDLNDPGPYLTRRAWAGYYLAIKSIFATGGAATLQAFVRALTDGKSAADAVRDSLSQEWPAFVAVVRDYSSESFKKFAIDDNDPQLQPEDLSRP